MSSAKTIGEIGSIGDESERLLFPESSSELADTGSVTAEQRSAPTIVDLGPATAPTWEESRGEMRPTFEAPITEAIVRPASHDPEDPSSAAPSTDDVELQAADRELMGAVTERIDRSISGSPTLFDSPHSDVTPSDETSNERAASDALAEPAPTGLAEFSRQSVDESGRTIEFSDELGAEADFELQLPGEPPAAVPTWDDSEYMERLLAGAADREAESAATEEAPEAAPVVTVAPALDLQTGKRPRRRKSMVRTLVGMAVAGLIGTAIGYYVVLAVAGPEGDFLQLARYMPSAVLPGSFARPELPIEKQPIVTGERQASFAAPPSTGEQELGEPRGFTAPQATEIGEADLPRVVAAPAYSPAELAASLEAARGAKAGLMAGSLADGNAVQRTKGASYSILSDLAQKVTFAASAAGNDVDHAAELFRSVLSNAQIREEVARIVPLWIGSKHRTHGGVFFGGTIVERKERGSVVEAQVDIGSGAPLSVLMLPVLANQLEAGGGPVGIVGSLVERPSEAISGFEGEAPQAIWVGRVVDLN
jgi:hypothetical protein